MQEIQRKNCIFMHFCTFISHFNMSMSVSALFTVPQLHYDFLPFYRFCFTLNYFSFVPMRELNLPQPVLFSRLTCSFSD